MSTWRSFTLIFKNIKKCKWKKSWALLDIALEKSTRQDVLSWESWPSLMICAAALDHKSAQKSCARFWSENCRAAHAASIVIAPPVVVNGGFGGGGFGAIPSAATQEPTTSPSFNFDADAFLSTESSSKGSTNGGVTFKSSAFIEPKRVSFVMLQQEVQRLLQDLQKISSQGGTCQAPYSQRMVQQVQQMQAFIQQAQQPLQQILPVAKQFEAAQDLQAHPQLLEIRREVLKLIQNNLQAPASNVSSGDLSKQALKKVRESTDDHLFARVAYLLRQFLSCRSLAWHQAWHSSYKKKQRHQYNRRHETETQPVFVPFFRFF